MSAWLRDLWQGFYTVLVGMKITWRHNGIAFDARRVQVLLLLPCSCFLPWESCYGNGRGRPQSG